MLLAGLAGGYMLKGQKSETSTAMTPINPTNSAMEKTAAPTPTVSIEADWATYTGTKLATVSLSPYTIKYPLTWTPKSTRTDYSDTYTLSNGDYQVAIDQVPAGGGGCLFEGDMPAGEFRPQDLRSVKFTEITTTEGMAFRRFLSTSAQPAGTLMEFCSSIDGTNWGMPTQLGRISYKIPAAASEEMILEMDSIIKTLKEVK